MMPGSILKMSTQELIPSPAKRKLLWRTMEKQQFLLLQNPREDGWGDGTWSQPGAWPGQEGNEVMVSACLNEWLSWCDWCPNAPPPNSFYLALHCSYSRARRTTHRLPGTTGLSERSHWSDLIPEVLPVTQALVSGGVLRTVSSACHSILSYCGRNQSGNIYWGLAVLRRWAKGCGCLAGSEWTPCNAGGQKKCLLFTFQLTSSCFQSPSPNMVCKLCLVREIHLFSGLTLSFLSAINHISEIFLTVYWAQKKPLLHLMTERELRSGPD